MTKDEYEDFALRYKGCGACFPMYHTLSRFEKMWFTAIQKDVAKLEKENKVLAQNLEDTEILNKTYEKRFKDLEKENAELKGEAASVLDNWCKGDDPCPHLKKRDEQLTKAKEIIKGLLPMASNFVFGTLPKLDEEVQLYKQAEQFLKEE